MSIKRLLITAGLLLGALLSFLFSTNPTRLSSALLVLPFFLLFGLLFVLATYYFQQTGFSKKQRLRLSALTAGLPCLLLVLESVDQLTIRDTIMLFGFFGLASLYAVRSSGIVPR